MSERITTLATRRLASEGTVPTHSGHPDPWGYDMAIDTPRVPSGDSRQPIVPSVVSVSEVVRSDPNGFGQG